MTTLTVEGMHCDACKKLIMMELEDAGLDTYVENVTVASTEKKGIFQLNELFDQIFLYVVLICHSALWSKIIGPTYYSRNIFN